MKAVAADTVEAKADTAGSKYDRLIAAAQRVAAMNAIVVHPCDEPSLRGAVEAANIGLIVPILVGPAGKIHAVAREHSLDIGKFELVDVAIATRRRQKPWS